MSAYYNEIDPHAVHVLRCLIAEGLIAPGDVDSRSITEIQPDDLRGYTQIHLFAGAGLWSVAARLAGWPDERSLWTASCPCQPFSAAGKGLGFDDPRHLWPHVNQLVDGTRAGGFGPDVIMGEQVAGAPGYLWFNGVRTDLAAQGYRAGVVDIPSCAVDAPHIRQRLYWCAVAGAGREPRRTGPVDPKNGAFDTNLHGARVEHASGKRRGEGRAEPELWSGRATLASADASGVTLGDAEREGLEGQRGNGADKAGRQSAPRSVAAPDGGDLAITASSGRVEGQSWPEAARHGGEPAAAHGRNGSFWSDHEWIICHDGKARRTEPGIRLLVDGMAGRIPAWRLAGNSINPILAAEAIAALREEIDSGVHA